MGGKIAGSRRGREEDDRKRPLARRRDSRQTGQCAASAGATSQTSQAVGAGKRGVSHASPHGGGGMEPLRKAGHEVGNEKITIVLQNQGIRWPRAKGMLGCRS